MSGQVQVLKRKDANKDGNPLYDKIFKLKPREYFSD